MEDDKRQLQPVHIGMATVETGGERFSSDGLFTPPTVSQWRNNLTALSQRYNLYFVATRAHIAAYAPIFPFQKLGRSPALYIPPAVANSTARGYIDPSNPHAINHLTVGDLGSEEILIVTTDSGNVAAYHTKSIEEAVKKHSSPAGSSGSKNYLRVRAFFCQWVYESAWGLAIHKHARMIAVSANVPADQRTNDNSAKITVFAFALTAERASHVQDSESDAVDEEGNSGWQTWKPDTAKPTRPDRNRNFKIVLRGPGGHGSNIPSISFINSSEDRNGKWLLSTDIGGELKAWQIWNGRCFKTWDFSDRESSSSYGWSARNRHRESSWLVAALDPLAFRPMDTMEEFCGWTRPTRYLGHSGTGESYDITNIVRSKVPGNSQIHPAFRGGEDLSDEDEIETETDVTFDLSSEDEVSSEVHGNHGTFHVDEPGPRTAHEDNQGGDLHLPLDSHIARGEHISHHEALSERVELLHSSGNGSEAPEGGEEQGQEVVQTLEAPYYDPEEIVSPVDSGGINESENETTDSDYGDDDSSSEMSLTDINTSGMSATDLSTLSRRLNAEEAEGEWIFNQGGEPQTSNSPPELASTGGNGGRRGSKMSKDVENAYLKTYLKAERQGINQRYGRAPLVPIIHCSASHLRMLSSLSAESPHLYCAQLLKQYLPTFVEHSQAAHLDRLNMIQQIPELGLVVIATQIGRCAVCTLTRRGRDGPLGIRVDWILPTKKQEKAELRPAAMLLGIAVGPVQGRMIENPPAPISKYDEDEKFAEDRIIHGVPTSFDSDVVILRSEPDRSSDRESQAGSESDDDFCENHLAPLSKNPKAKRKRSPSPSSPVESRFSELKVEHRPWMKSVATEDWRGRENSRRYRLMMTYTDQTVLVYEMWREWTEEDISTRWHGSRRNWRNRPAF